jgi:long-chain acyl-CoA synthetase
MAADTDWRRAEEEYTDEVIGDTTLARMFEASAARHADGEAQWYKGGVYDRSLAQEVVPEAPDGKFAALTYAEMQGIVRNLAAGFRSLGLEPGDRVGIFANTRMEWAQADFGVLAAGGVVSTVYTESSPNQVRYLLGDSGATGVVVENGELLERVLEVEDDLDVEWMVVIDEFEGHEDREDVLSLADLYARGAEEFDTTAYEEWLAERDLDDLASLVYTSGTTSQPKGVRLTHGNFRSNVNAIRKRFGPRRDKGPEVPMLDADIRALSFLPLAHVFERTAGHFTMFASGATVAYAEKPDTVAEDIKAVEPSSATSVPRVYERIFDGMREQASESDLKERIFGWATDVARDYARADSPSLFLEAKFVLADRLVFSSVKEQMGGNVDFFISGGGSLDEELARLFNGMGLPILEGYGLTETSPVVSTNPPEDIREGTLGTPLSNVDVRLDGSVVTDDQEPTEGGEIGELLVKGPNVTEGYRNKPEATEEAFTEDGWFRTGDIIERTDDDYLVYRDRLKQLIVLSTGKNVAPGPIESAFATSERVDQVMVMGDDEKFISALIVPDFEALTRWAEEEEINLPVDREELVDDERVREWVREAVDEANQEFEKHETIKQFELVPTEWTADNDLLTPSMKKKRRNIMAEFEDRIDRIYGDKEEKATT